MQFLPLFSILISQIWNIPRQKGGHFSRKTFWVPPLCYLEKCSCALHLLSKQLDLRNSRTKQGHFLRQTFWVPTPLCYFENCSFCPISLLQVLRFENSRTKGAIIFSQIFWACTALCYLDKCNYCQKFLKCHNLKRRYGAKLHFWRYHRAVVTQNAHLKQLTPSYSWNFLNLTYWRGDIRQNCIFQDNIRGVLNMFVSKIIHLCLGSFQIWLLVEEIWGQNCSFQYNTGQWVLKTFVSKNYSLLSWNFLKQTTWRGDIGKNLHFTS